MVKYYYTIKGASIMEDKKIKDFLELAKKTGKIKDVKEAFIEYPVENEWHKGKIENVLELSDNNEEYLIYKIGDIVFVNDYRYDNGAKGKNHLFVIIEQNNLAVPIENFGMLISSNIEKLKYKSNKFINKDNKNGLHKDSIVKTDVIYKISNEQILFKIGEVDIDKVEEYKKSFYEELNKKD
jgi:hypothetical protein